MNTDLNLDGRSTDGYGDECPEFDKCGQYLVSTDSFWIAECSYHGRFAYEQVGINGYYVALDF